MNTSKTRFSTILTILALSFSAPAYAQPSAPDNDSIMNLEQFNTEHISPRELTSVSQTEWQGYANRLTQTLKADNSGLQQSALQQIIRYGDYLETDKETVFEIVKIYRNNEDERMRRMAVVALGELEDSWSMGFLERAVKFEKNAQVSHTIKYILKNYAGSFQ